MKTLSLSLLFLFGLLVSNTNSAEPPKDKCEQLFREAYSTPGSLPILPFAYKCKIEGRLCVFVRGEGKSFTVSCVN